MLAILGRNWRLSKSIITNKIETLRTIRNENRTIRQNFKDRDSIILGDHSRHTVPDEVNLHYWSPAGETENLGDYLSEIVVGHYANLHKKISGGGTDICMPLVP